MRGHSRPCHPSESVVIYEGPNGEVSYPPRNDVPMPARLRARGFQRRELRNLHDVAQFEKSHKVVHERSWYDSNGRGMDSYDPPVPNLDGVEIREVKR